MRDSQPNFPRDDGFVRKHQGEWGDITPTDLVKYTRGAYTRGKHGRPGGRDTFDRGGSRGPNGEPLRGGGVPPAKRVGYFNLS